MLTNFSILTQPENNAADRQISMIIVITNNNGSELLVEPSMITAEVRDALESTRIIKVELCLTNSHNHFTVVCSGRKG